MLRQLTGTAAAAVLALLWMLALGAGTTLSSPASFAVLALVLITFWLTHIHRERPAGWHFSRLRWPGAAWLLWGAIMAMLIIGWRLLVVLNVGPDPETQAQQPSTWTLVAAILAAPLIEEFGFRLWLQSQLERWMPALAAIALASAAFSAIHDWERWYLHLVSGIIYGWALWLSGSIWLPVAMHSLANGLLALLNGHAGIAGWFDRALTNQPHWLDEATLLCSAALLGGAALGFWIARGRPHNLRGS